MNRYSGAVLHVGNRSLERLNRFGGSRWGVNLSEDYRQAHLEVYDWRTKAIRKTGLEFDPWDKVSFALVYGSLVTERYAKNEGFEINSGNEVGALPFGNSSQILNLIRIMKYLLNPDPTISNNPIQIEGAYRSSSSKLPYLYQKTTVPSTQAEGLPLSIAEAHIISDKVLGKGKFTGPLIYVPPIDNFESEYVTVARFHKIDQMYAKTGYILLTSVHSQRVMTSTPNCRYRVGIKPHASTSHAISLIRLNNSRAAPEDQHILLTEAEPRMGWSILDSSANRMYEDGTRVFNEATLESNGQKAALLIPRIKKGRIALSAETSAPTPWQRFLKLMGIR